MSRSNIAILLGVFIFLWVGLPSSVEADAPEIQGLAGLKLDGDSGFMAIRIQVPENQALDGILWYNNDGLLEFPRIFAGTGYLDKPGSIQDAVVVAEGISGVASGWSSVEFDQPVGASLGGLYVVFEFPNQPYTAPGNGGGAAIGYSEAENGSLGWISGNGEEWSSLHPDFGFSILPTFVPFEEGMAVKSLDGSDKPDVNDDVVEKLYLSMGPNPFNPQTEIRFGLPSDSHVRLEIFDLRGRLVTRLLDEFLSKGHHSVTWLGKNEQGGNVASAVYLVRISAGNRSLVQRLTLVR